MSRIVRMAVALVASLTVVLVLPMRVDAAPKAATETLRVTGQVVVSKGTNVLRVKATGKVGTTPSTGRLEVVLYGSAYIPEDFTIIEERYAVVGSVTLVNGAGTVDIPITSALVRKARPPQFLHASCCDVIVRRPGSGGATSPKSGVAGLPGFSYYGPVKPSSTSMYLDVMSRLAIGHTIDDAAIVHWGAVLAGGASRTVPSRAMVESDGWRRYRAIQLYQDWLGRRPTASELTYWTDRLTRDTTSGIDLAMAAKPAVRDAGGTTNAQRGAHLAKALHLPASYGSNYTTKLDAGMPWTTVVREAYWSSAAVERRMLDLGPRSSFTPSVAALGSEHRRTGDERSVHIKVLATLPTQYEVAW